MEEVSAWGMVSFYMIHFASSLVLIDTFYLYIPPKQLSPMLSIFSPSFCMPRNGCLALHGVNPSKKMNHPFNLMSKSKKYDTMARDIAAEQMLGLEARSKS